MVNYLQFIIGGKLLIDENLKIKIKINNKNIDHYEKLGYTGLFYGSEIEVKQTELSPTSHTKIKCICDYCGEQYETCFCTYYNSMNHSDVQKCACSSCAGKKNSEVRLIREREKRFPELIEVCEKHGYTLLTKKEEYAGVDMNVRFICPKHGEKTMIMDNLLNGHVCYECSYEYRASLLRNSAEKIISDIESINNNKLLNPEDYLNAITPNLKILCGCCGENVFYTSYSNYIRHEVNRCKYCSSVESLGEKTVRLVLEKININFIQEKRFEDCKNIRSLPFDFYIPSLNLIIEYDGEQHYYPVFGEESFQNTQKNDLIKNDYCAKNGILLLRIPYWEMKNIENIIVDYLNKTIGKRYDLIS